MNELLIDHLGPLGDGVSVGRRGRIYVDRSLPGERIKAEITRDTQGVMRAEPIQIHTPSAHRQNPPCPHYSDCGNCSMQHVRDGFYRSWKTEMVKNQLSRYSVFPDQWLPPIFMRNALRRRATFTLRRPNKRSPVVMGYYRRRSQSVTEIESCMILDPTLMALKKPIQTLFETAIMSRETVDIFLQIIDGHPEMLITGVPQKGRSPLWRKQLAKWAQALGLSRVGWRSSYDCGIEILFHQGPLIASFGPLRVPLPLGAFLQPTQEGENALVNSVMRSLPPVNLIADLFSGCGTFSGPLLYRGMVDAYDSDKRSINALGKAARHWPLQVKHRDLFSVPIHSSKLNAYDAILFDPPRQGCERQAREMARSRVKTIIGISCQVESFARDARSLCQGNYRLLNVQIIDQFQWSHHVEVVGVFSKG